MSASKDRKGLIVLFSMLVVLIAAAVVISFSLRSNPVKDNLKEDSLIKVLFVISDDENRALATDVLLYYPQTRKCAVFNIPGNVGAIYESIGRTDRIDAVYAELGVSAYKKEIESLTGLNIPYSIEISLENLGKLTDLFGGMSVFIPSPVDEKSEEGEYWMLPSGAITLDGDKLQTSV